jgi:hypothetical protein
LDDDHIFIAASSLNRDTFGLDDLLLARLQGSFALRFAAHSLHCIHHIRLLGYKGIPQVRSPLDVAGHSSKRVGNRGKRLHTRIPGLLRYGIGKGFVLKTRVVCHPLLKLDDFEWIS